MLAALPPRGLPANPPESAADILGNGIVVVIVVGFWLRMLIECATVRALRHKLLWLLSFLLLPIFSAFIYFATTRSIRAELRTEDSTTPPRR